MYVCRYVSQSLGLSLRLAWVVRGGDKAKMGCVVVNRDVCWGLTWLTQLVIVGHDRSLLLLVLASEVSQLRTHHQGLLLVTHWEQRVRFRRRTSGRHIRSKLFSCQLVSIAWQRCHFNWCVTLRSLVDLHLFEEFWHILKIALLWRFFNFCWHWIDIEFLYWFLFLAFFLCLFARRGTHLWSFGKLDWLSKFSIKKVWILLSLKQLEGLTNHWNFVIAWAQVRAESGDICRFPFAQVFVASLIWWFWLFFLIDRILMDTVRELLVLCKIRVIFLAVTEVRRISCCCML